MHIAPLENGGVGGSVGGWLEAGEWRGWGLREGSGFLVGALDHQLCLSSLGHESLALELQQGMVVR